MQTDPDDNAFLRLASIFKSYGRYNVLSIKELSLYEGQVVLLEGGNGSGKSTLLRILAGIGSVNEGSIQRSSRCEGSRLGFLPQQGGLYQDATIRENFLMRRRLAGLKYTSPDDNRFFVKFGLHRFYDKKVQYLSGGYQRIAAVATMFHCEPTWVLLDEPFSSVDSKLRDELIKQFNTISPAYSLFILADPNEIPQFRREITLQMSEGKIG